MKAAARVKDAKAALRIERSLRRVQHGEQEMLRLAREAFPAPAPADPLVSVTIPTYNRADLLFERALPSILSQTYRNLEVIIVGDHCTDSTEERVRGIEDPRVRFVNLEARPDYPTRPLDRWRVAGSVPINRALFECRGDWIAYLDDDDEALPTRIERSLEIAASSGAEFICGQVSLETAPGVWRSTATPTWPTGKRPFRPLAVPHSAAMYRSYLRFMLYSSSTYQVALPTDRQWITRLARIGVVPELVSEVFTTVRLRPGETSNAVSSGSD